MGGEIKRTAGWYVWILWVTASFIGGGFGIAIAFSLIRLFGNSIHRPWLEIMIYGLYLAGLGTAQWIILRRFLPAATWWAGASALSGVVLGYAIGTIVYTPNILIGSATVGFVLGIFQFLVLRGSIHNAWCWLLANPIGWVLAALLGTGLENWISTISSETTGMVIYFSILCGLAGTVTGGVLFWLLREDQRTLSLV